jgi:2',3'-cyclic-nucleotide 2'-phosphodiesterase (5'-nucleotidase family)
MTISMPSVYPAKAGLLLASQMAPMMTPMTVSQPAAIKPAGGDGFFRQPEKGQHAAPPAGYIPPVIPASKMPGYHSLRIVYNNDPHEKFKALPHLVSAFRFLSQQGEAANRDVLRLNSGDNNVGREPQDWKLNVRLMNMINYHAVTMGNHELDLGSAKYGEGLSLATFPTVLSNLEIKPGSTLAQRVREGKIKIQPQVLRSGRGTYGLIGVTTPELKKVVSTRAKLEGEEVQDFDDTVEIVKAQVEWLQSQGINKIIVLSHMGYDLDQKLAKQVAGIDIIVGGHSHDVVNGITPGVNYLKTPAGEPVLIVQGGKNAQWMGVADVLFDPQGRVIPQQSQLFNPNVLPPDPQALALRNSVMGQPKKLAVFNTAYDANGNEFKADAVAQFTADALRAVSGSDIAFVRSPELRSNFDAGVFTDQDLNALMPFTDPIVRLPLTGGEILKALNRSAQGIAKKESHPGMLHPSGMAVSMSKQLGQVLQAYVFNKRSGQWELLDPNKRYQVAIGEFTVLNKEFPEFAHRDRVEWNSGQPIRNFFAWGLNQAGAYHNPLSFKDDGRLQVI